MDPSNKMNELALEFNESSKNVQENLGSLQGRLAIWFTGLWDEMPDWAINHIVLYTKLEEAVNKMEASGDLDKVPNEVSIALKSGKDLVRVLANAVSFTVFVNDVLPAINQGRTTDRIDQYGLLSSDSGREIKQSQTEWHLNLGLLMNAYHRTKDPVMKKQIEFLALHYLAKAAPIDLSLLGLKKEEAKKFEQKVQLGVFEEAIYHREADVFNTQISENLRDTFPDLPSLAGQTFLTDTTEFQELLPLFFTMVDIPKSDKSEEGVKSVEQKALELPGGWSKSLTNNLTNAMITHFKNNPEDSFNRYIDPPIIADLTDLIGDNIQTNGDKAKEAILEGKLKDIEAGFEKAIDQAIERISKEHPELCKTGEDETKLRVFLRFNIACICRTELKGVGVLKSVHLFMDPKYYVLPEGTTNFLKLSGKSEALAKSICQDKTDRTNKDLFALVNYSGIRLGGVSGRKKIFNFIDLEQFLAGQRQMTEYSVKGPNVVAFQNKEALTRTSIFKKFKNEMQNKNNLPVTILGKATIDIFEGLLGEITEKKWQELNDNPDTRMIFQQSLYRLMGHFATAQSQIHDFTTFAQTIELAQSEIATLLMLSSPFKEKDFQEIYKTSLADVVPDELKGNIKAGVAKSAMNVFVGVNAAVQQMNSSAERVHGEGVYFEEVTVLGKNREIQEVLNDPNVSSVDLYVGEFNHNINLHLNHDHYMPGAVKEEIRQILSNKNLKTKHLTVAIDVTIDFINSPRAKELLEEFSKEIKDGTLNFVFFRSGQKFEMFGIDNYYGGPFWMVNNGDKQWKNFEKLTTSDTYKADPLSVQWFCLSNKYAPQSLDDYRRQIFNNSASILKDTPADFKKGGKYANEVRISTVDNGMQPNFIDIKVLHPRCGTVGGYMEKRLIERFAKAGIKIHKRASFGFYHANLNVIEAYHDDRGKRNIRINPGLDDKENKIILDFIKEDIPKILEEVNESSKKSTKL